MRLNASVPFYTTSYAANYFVVITDANPTPAHHYNTSHHLLK
jgi:hypothetical protein